MEAYLSMAGWVGTDVEHRQTRTGLVTASFRLACTPRLRRGGEWADGETNWVTVTCYRSLAENVAASVTKGEPVVVVGRLRTSAWVDESGTRHERQVLEASTVGHDLSRGTTSFQRSERATAEEEPDDTMKESILRLEAQQQESSRAQRGAQEDGGFQVGSTSEKVVAV